MNALLNDIWLPVFSALLTSFGLYIGYIHQLRMKVAVMEKTIDNIQRRMDNHSKKQDDILEAITQLKVEIVGRFADYEKNINAIVTEQAVISTEVKNITKTLSTIERKPF